MRGRLGRTGKLSEFISGNLFPLRTVNERECCGLIEFGSHHEIGRGLERRYTGDALRVDDASNARGGMEFDAGLFLHGIAAGLGQGHAH